MALENRLEGMRQRSIQQGEDERRRAEEEKLTGTRQQITDRQEERNRLASLSQELDGAYAESSQNVQSARVSREKISELFSRYQDTLEKQGIHSVGELLTSEDFSGEHEVAAHTGEYARVLQGTRKVRATKADVRAALGMVGERSTSDWKTGVAPRRSQERIRAALQDRIRRLDSEILELEAQTPEAREARERQEEMRQRIDRRSRPKLGASTGISVMPKDLEDAKEFGEEAVRGAIVQHYEGEIDQTLKQKRDEDGVEVFEQDLAALEENRRAYDEAVGNFKAMMEHYREALKYVEQFNQPRDSDLAQPGRQEQDLIARLIRRRLDTPLMLSVDKGSIPRPFSDYLKDGWRSEFPVKPSDKDGYNPAMREAETHSRSYPATRPTRKIEDFRSTAEQIEQIDELLQEVLTMSDIELKFQLEHGREKARPTTSFGPTVTLQPKTVDMLTRNNVDALREKVALRYSADEEQAERLKATLPKSVARDWKEQTYQVFEGDSTNKKVIQRLQERERDLPVATEIVRLIDALRPRVMRWLDADVTIFAGFGKPTLSLKNNQETDDHKNAWQRAVRNNDQANSTLQDRRSDLEHATGILKYNERKRINAEIAKLEASLIDEGEIRRMRAEYEGAEKDRRQLEGGLSDLVSKVGRRVKEGQETLRLEDWLNGLDARYRPIVEAKVSDEDQAILDRHRTFAEERRYGSWS